MKTSTHPPLSLLSPSEYLRTRLSPRLRGNGSPRVWSPSAPSAPEARFTRVCLARHLPSPGFRTLLTAYVFQNLPALFHAGNAHGVFPSGLFPLTEPSHPFGCGCLPDVGPARSHHPKRTPDRHRRAGSLAFKALLPVRIRHLPDRFDPNRKAAALLGFRPSRGFLPAAARRLRVGSPRELRGSLNPKTRAARCPSGF